MVPARQTPGLVGGSRTLLEDAVLEGPQERPVQDEDDLQFHDVSDSWPEPEALCCFSQKTNEIKTKKKEKKIERNLTAHTTTHANARPH